MNGRRHLTPTLVSLWSAMLGGALGTVVGLFSSKALLNGMFGGMAGLVCSVPFSILLMALAQTVTTVLGVDIEDAPIGCPTTSQLSGTVGGITGMIGAVVLTYNAQGHRITDPWNFAICWTVSTVVALALTLVVVLRPRRTWWHTGANTSTRYTSEHGDSTDIQA